MRWLSVVVVLCSCARAENAEPPAKPVPSEAPPLPPPPTPTPPPPPPTPSPTVPTPVPSVTGACAEYAGDYSGALRAHDFGCVRAILLPRLEAKTITSAEARYLKAACGALGDAACEKRAAKEI